MKQVSRITFLSLMTVAMIMQLSCNNKKKKYSGMPIRLGDTFTIVTETDSVYLTDLVLDMDFAPAPDPIEVAQDSTTQAPKPAVPLSKEMMLSGGGLKAPFPDVTMFIPSITTRTFQDIDFSKANGASYQLTSGELNDNYLILPGATITDVSMRYQSVIVVRNDMGMLELSSLRTLTDWQSMAGKNGMYKISGLTSKEIKHANVSNPAIVNAVNRETKNKRMSRAAQNAWELSVKNANNTSTPPLYVELTAVMWKVRGKDKDGKNFQKQLRIDIPVPITVNQ